MTFAIHYHPEGYTTSGPRLMGRNAAGKSFLRGFFNHARTDAFWVHVTQREHARLFAEAARETGRHEPITVVDNASLDALTRPGGLFLPGPGLGVQAWMRASHGHGAWSLCGITHTTASAVAMDALAELLTAPVQPWDALICTSTAVKDMVRRVLQAQAEHLAQRLGARQFPLPQLPVIPLGVHAGDFAFTPQQRAEARAAMGVGDRSLVTLFVGRLSFHAKGHPLAMYQALEQAAGALPEGHEAVLVECGWHANEAIAQAYREAARRACPSVRVVTLDGRNPRERLTAWACADIFCSFPDNIQETFGLTPVEAMAAGLPTVVSDWDGYKDTIRDGQDGFRIPTLAPEGGLGRDMAMRHALGVDTYDMYCGHTCSLVAVDVQAAAQAFCRLFASAELRGRMGAAGRQRAVDEYEWRTIIPRYEALWMQMAEIRRINGPALRPPQHPWPARMDPFAAFAAYPTRQLGRDTILALAAPTPEAAWTRFEGLRTLAMTSFSSLAPPTPAECRAVLQALAQGPQSAAVLASTAASHRQAAVFRGLAWLVKLGILRAETS